MKVFLFQANVSDIFPHLHTIALQINTNQMSSKMFISANTFGRTYISTESIDTRLFVFGFLSFLFKWLLLPCQAVFIICSVEIKCKPILCHFELVFSPAVFGPKMLFWYCTRSVVLCVCVWVRASVVLRILSFTIWSQACEA